MYIYWGFCYLCNAFLLCSLISFLTGTSFGTAATMGVICMTMAKSMNISEIVAGGAILSGIYLGDRCSPFSTSALLVSELTKTNLYENLKEMSRTAIVPFTVSCVAYWILGIQTHAGKAEENIRTILSEFYHLSIWTLAPVIVVLVFSFLLIEVKRTLTRSAFTGIFVAVLIQKYPVLKLSSLCIWDFSPENQLINKLMGGGGILSNMKAMAIVGISSCYAGILKVPIFCMELKNSLGN